MSVLENKPKVRILVVDNNRDYRKTLIRLLNRLSRRFVYEFKQACNPEDGGKYLDNEWAHLAIVDLRLRDDNDPTDESGLDLLLDTGLKSYGVMPRLILTAFSAEWQGVRKALRENRDRIRPAVDWLAKDEEPEKIVRKIEEIITRYQNVGLEIDWGSITPLCLASILESDGNHQDPVALSLRAWEMTNLFQQIYNDGQVQRISIRDIRPGHADSFIAFIQTYVEGEIRGREDVVKCGQREDIEKEGENFEKYVRPYGIGVQALGVAKTLRYGAICYRPAGGQGARTSELFNHFYHGESVKNIIRVLECLFSPDNGIFRGWHQTYKSKSGDLEKHYREHLGIYRKIYDIERRLNEFARRQVAQAVFRRERSSLTVEIDGTIVARVPHFGEIVRGKKSLSTQEAYWWGVTHGDLHGENILVEAREGNSDNLIPWVVDFERTGPGHALQDFIELEGVIRWELIRTSNFSHIYQFEQFLMDVGLRRKADVKKEIKSDKVLRKWWKEEWGVDLKKAATIIMYLRDVAGKITNREVSTYREYLTGLFFHALRFIVTVDSTSRSQARSSFVRQAHALLTAAMIANLAQNQWKDM